MRIIAALLVSVLLIGCTSGPTNMAFRDTASQRIYRTNSVPTIYSNGTVILTDADTGAAVTLRSWESIEDGQTTHKVARTMGRYNLQRVDVAE